MQYNLVTSGIFHGQKLLYAFGWGRGLHPPYPLSGSATAGLLFWATVYRLDSTLWLDRTLKLYSEINWCDITY